MKNLLFLSVVIFSLTIFLFAAKKPKIAVLEINDVSGKFDTEVTEIATKVLRGELAASGRFIVIDKTKTEVKTLKNIKASKKCIGIKCDIPLGRSLSADTILRTTISCLGTACTLSSELIDLAKEASIGGSTADFDGTPEGVARAVKKVVKYLADNFGGDEEAADPYKLFNEAKKADKSGSKMPEKAFEAWKRLAIADHHDNPYKGLARKKMRQWQTLINRRTELAEAREKEISELISLLSNYNIEFEIKKKRVIKYRDTYSSAYGKDDILSILNIIPDPKLKQRLKKVPG